MENGFVKKLNNETLLPFKNNFINQTILLNDKKRINFFAKLVLNLLKIL